MTSQNGAHFPDQDPAHEMQDDSSNETIKSLIESIAALEAEKNELKDRVLRALADAENARRRAEKDVADAKTYGITAFARDMLNVADNLRRALDNVGGEQPEIALKALLEGLDLTERDLMKSFERHGVTRIEPKGEKFDPNLHQAMFEAQNPDMPNGYVMEVIQTGFRIGDRVLRPAMVGIARGGPKAAEPNDGQAA